MVSIEFLDQAWNSSTNNRLHLKDWFDGAAATSINPNFGLIGLGIPRNWWSSDMGPPNPPIHRSTDSTNPPGGQSPPGPPQYTDSTNPSIPPIQIPWWVFGDHHTQKLYFSLGCLLIMIKSIIFLMFFFCVLNDSSNWVDRGPINPKKSINPP